MMNDPEKFLSNCYFKRFSAAGDDVGFQFCVRPDGLLVASVMDGPRCLSEREIDYIINVLNAGKKAILDNSETVEKINSNAIKQYRLSLLPQAAFPASEKPKNYVYLMIDKRNGLVKIGRSTDPGRREKTLQSEVPEISMIGAWEVPVKTESQLHRKYARQRVRGEWFDLSEADVKAIKAHLHNVEKNHE